MSLAIRVAIGVAVLTILTAVLVTGSAIVSTSAGVRGDVDDFLQERAEEIADGSRQRPDRRDRDDSTIDLDDAEDLAEAVDLPAATDFDAQVQVLDTNAEIIASTGLDLPVSNIDETLVEQDIAGEYQNTVVDGIEYRLYTAHIDGGGAVQVATSTEESQGLVDVLRTRLIIIGGLLAAAAALIGWFITRRTLKPLGDLAQAVEQVRETQEFDQTVAGAGSGGEIGRLATEFNGMLEALSNSRRQQHQLVQDAAHELRTPLTSVSANIEILDRNLDLPEQERHEILTGIRSELKQLSLLFTEITELATDRWTSNEFTDVDLVDVVDRVVSDFSTRTSQEINVAASSSIVSGDFDSLSRAVTNILGNAVKYSPEGTAIDIKVSSGTISIRDRGVGISQEERSKVFDRFYRADESRSQPGSGLGLAIVDKIVSDHNGSTFVQDPQNGPGTVVGFSVPTVV